MQAGFKNDEDSDKSQEKSNLVSKGSKSSKESNNPKQQISFSEMKNVFDLIMSFADANR